MPQKHKKTIKRKPKSRLHKVRHATFHHAKKHSTTAKNWYQKASIIQKIGVWLLAIFIVILSIMYSISQWYTFKHKNEPLQIGATFIAPYAERLGLDPKETLQASINDLGITRYRLVSYWNVGEPQKDTYDFSELDWQFDMVEQAGGTVTLALGARQPRWPECHIPDWAQNSDEEIWKAELKEYIAQVVNRYKDRPALVSYQMENEYFLEVFGECEDHTRQRLIDQFNLVKQLDQDKPVIVSRSNNATPSWPVGKPRADIVGASIYKRVWDRTLTKRYFEYPFPAWFYGFLAGATEITTGRNTFIHEMQAEPWPPKDILEVSLEEQDKSFNASMMKDRINFGVATGMRTIDMWGMEWWYYRKVKFNDFSVWEEAQQEIQRLNNPDINCPSRYNDKTETDC